MRPIVKPTPLPYEHLTKIKCVDEIASRHIEQLWDEIKKLKERVKKLEKEDGMEAV